MTGAVEVTAGSWHDLALDVADAARVRLSLHLEDPYTPQLEGMARAAMRAIDERLALQPVTGRYSYSVSDAWAVVTYAADAAPADVLEAATQLTVELARRKDASFGVLNSVGLSGEPVRVSRDQLAGVDTLLEPHIEGWGLA